MNILSLACYTSVIKNSALLITSQLRELNTFIIFKDHWTILTLTDKLKIFTYNYRLQVV